MAPFDEDELNRLIDVVTRLHPNDVARLATAAAGWSSRVDDEAKARMLRMVRRAATWPANEEAMNDPTMAAALGRMEQALEPAAAVARFRWLFETQHPEWRSLVEDEVEGRISWREREALVETRRAEAISEIETEIGRDALLQFALSVRFPAAVAQVLVPVGCAPELVAEWVHRALRSENCEKCQQFLRQILWTAGLGDMEGAIRLLIRNPSLTDEASRRRIAECLPGHAPGWKTAEQLGQAAEDTYWRHVTIHVSDSTSEEEVTHAVENLLRVERARSAFQAVWPWLGKLSAEAWEGLLTLIAQGQEREGPFPASYQIEQVLEVLDRSPEIPNERVAQVELPFFRVLRHYGHGSRQRILTTHRVLNCDPAFFVRLLCWHYQRHDDAEEDQVDTLPPEQHRRLLEMAFDVLHSWDRLPGEDDDGNVDAEAFASWTRESFRLAAEMGRLEAAELHLAAVIARVARRRNWEDWLPAPVLEMLDRVEQAGLRERLPTGIFNARGITMRAPYDGGAQERVLASRYLELAARYSNEHPRLAATLKEVARDYEREARREDDQAAVGERWRP